MHTWHTGRMRRPLSSVRLLVTKSPEGKEDADLARTDEHLAKLGGCVTRGATNAWNPDK
jgi:hypothetical protein